MNLGDQTVLIAAYVWFFGSIILLWRITWYIAAGRPVWHVVPLFLYVFTMNVTGAFLFYEYWTAPVWWHLLRYSWMSIMVLLFPVVLAIHTRL